MKLKSTITACAMAVIGLAVAGSGANAVVYSLDNVQLSDNGVLNGTFDIEFGGLFGFNISTTGGAAGLDTTYVYQTNPASQAIPFGSPTVLKFFPNSATAELQLTFSGDLSVAGTYTLLGGINGPSFECNSSFSCAASIPGDYPNRFVASDTLVGPAVETTPLPAALPLFAAGLGLFGFAARRRKRKNAAVRAAA